MQANPDMLILARELAGLSQTELAGLTGINQSVLSKYESGNMAPSAKHLEVLAEKLDVPVAFFEIPEKRYKFGSSCTYHRKQQSATATLMNQILAEINFLRIHASFAIESVDIQTDACIPRLDIEDFDGDVEKIAELSRRSLLVSGGPVRNLVATIESAGGIVVARSFGNRKLDAVSQWPSPSAPPVFLVNSDAPVDRQRFTLAHELGHLVMHRVPTNDMEREADAFASAFLMPREEIEQELEGLQLQMLNGLKLRWRVSMAALIRKARDLGKITDGQYRSFNIRLAKAGHKLREPDVLEAEKPALFTAILETYRDSMGYTNDDLCRLLRMTPRRLMADYGIGSQESPKSFLRLA